jgi:hypothetical protein
MTPKGGARKGATPAPGRTSPHPVKRARAAPPAAGDPLEQLRQGVDDRLEQLRLFAKRGQQAQAAVDRLTAPFGLTRSMRLRRCRCPACDAPAAVTAVSRLEDCWACPTCGCAGTISYAEGARD